MNTIAIGARRVAATLLGTVAIVAGAWAADTPTTLSGVTVVSADEAKKMVDKGVPIIDTRVASEYAEKTIKGAKSVPYREKSAKAVDFDRKQDQWDLAKLPQDKAAPVIFFCNAGECWKSYKSATVARDNGWKQVYWLRGGLPEWISKGLPTQ